MHPFWTRRAFMAALAATVEAADKPAVVPTEVRRFRDPATEFDLTRLTDPERSNCWLPRPPLKSLSSRSNSLLYVSDRTGSVQGYRLDLRSGESRQLTDAKAMDSATLSWTPDERSLIYFDGADLNIAGRGDRTVYTVEPGWEHIAPYALSDTAQHAAVVEQRAGRYRVRVIGIRSRDARTIFEASEPVRQLRFRPKRAALLYNHNGGLWVVNLDGRASQRLPIAAGEAGDAHWSADGRTVHYLLAPKDRPRSVYLREYNLETNEDKSIGMTTQFISFTRNGDSTVFAGVSRSQAAPYLLLLIRAASREMTVAEHKASDASKAAVLFSPNSQRLYYHTDREGKSAIYMIQLERFIERTDDEASSARLSRIYTS
jgi:oligogalacturonide lyase